MKGVSHAHGALFCEIWNKIAKFGTRKSAWSYIFILDEYQERALTVSGKMPCGAAKYQELQHELQDAEAESWT